MSFLLLALACTKEAPPRDSGRDSDPVVEPHDSALDSPVDSSGDSHDSSPVDSLPDTNCPPEVDADGDGSPDSEDCDDTDPGVYPGAPEVCDGRDNDCDGVDDRCVLAADADARFLGEAVEDRMGSSLGGADLDGDGRAELLVGAAYHDSDAGVVYILDGAATGDVALSTVTDRVVGPSSNWYVSVGASAGDVDGDGADELVVLGARSSSTDGMVGVFLDPIIGEREVTSAELLLEPRSSGDASGGGIQSMDADGDGELDLALGASHADTSASNAGAVHVVAGPMLAGRRRLGAGVTWTGEVADDRAGGELVAEDVDGDGVDDLWIGVPRHDPDEEYAGAVYLLLGPITVGGTLADADRKLLGSKAREMEGSALASAGDLDGDGSPELLIGSNQEVDPDPGHAWIVSGMPSGSGQVQDEAVAKLVGNSPSDGFGRGLTGVGDFAGDGTPGFAVGAWNDGHGIDGANGAVFIWFGAVSGSVSARSSDRKVLGEGLHDMLGYSLAGPGDVDGDGVDDLFAGAMHSDESDSFAGTAYLFLGGP